LPGTARKHTASAELFGKTGTCGQKEPQRLGCSIGGWELFGQKRQKRLIIEALLNLVTVMAMDSAAQPALSFGETLMQTPLGFYICIGLLVILCVLVLLCFFRLKQRTEETAETSKAQWRSDMSSVGLQITEKVNAAQKESMLRQEASLKDALSASANRDRTELLQTLTANQRMTADALAQNDMRFQAFAREQLARTDRLTGELTQALKEVREKVDSNLQSLQASNEAKLEKIRATVEDQLQSTLQQRVSESFRLVSERLNEVYAGLNDMKRLASDVGSLKQVLVNVKNRGMLGEVQLEALLTEYFAASQFAKNFHPNPSSPSLVVEFAVRMPGKEGEDCWLPIDSKFPLEDFARLQEALENGDRAAAQASRDALKSRILKEAKDIARYICPPTTTDFAILFLPSESLYAEVLSIDSLAQRLFTQFRVYVMGPSTLASALCAYRAGFQSMAIEKRSAQVRLMLTEVKTEFEKFETVLKNLKRQLDTASRTVDQVEVRTRQMNRKLTDVEGGDRLPDSDNKLSLPDSGSVE
jgi:DNA recombination protein RmuC